MSCCQLKSCFTRHRCSGEMSFNQHKNSVHTASKHSSFSAFKTRYDNLERSCNSLILASTAEHLYKHQMSTKPRIVTRDHCPRDRLFSTTSWNVFSNNFYKNSNTEYCVEGLLEHCFQSSALSDKIVHPQLRAMKRCPNSSQWERCGQRSTTRVCGR